MENTDLLLLAVIALMAAFVFILEELRAFCNRILLCSFGASFLSGKLARKNSSAIAPLQCKHLPLKSGSNNAGCAQLKKIRREFTFEALFWKTRRSKIFRHELLYIVNEQFAACGLQVILDKVYMHGV